MMVKNLIEKGLIFLMAFLLVIGFSSAYINISAKGPANNTWQTTLWTNFSFNVSWGNQHGDMENVSIWTNFTGTWARLRTNQTAVTNATVQWMDYNFTSGKSFIWGLYVYNTTFNGSNFAYLGNKSLKNWTLKIDNLTPTGLTFANPTPANNSWSNSRTFIINLTATEVNKNYTRFRLFNNTSYGVDGDVNDTSASAAGYFNNTLTAGADGTYYYNVSLFDKALNKEISGLGLIQSNPYIIIRRTQITEQKPEIGSQLICPRVRLTSRT
jgi:hypothetical protein